MKMSGAWAIAATASVVKRRRPVARLPATISSSPGSKIGICPGLEPLDLACVHVDADHVVADFGEAGPGHQANIAGAENGDAHAKPVLGESEQVVISAKAEIHLGPVRLKQNGFPLSRE